MHQRASNCTQKCHCRIEDAHRKDQRRTIGCPQQRRGWQALWRRAHSWQASRGRGRGATAIVVTSLVGCECRIAAEVVDHLAKTVDVLPNARCVVN